MIRSSITGGTIKLPDNKRSKPLTDSLDKVIENLTETIEIMTIELPFLCEWVDYLRQKLYGKIIREGCVVELVCLGNQDDFSN